MNWIVDIVLVSVFAITVIVNAKRGFVRSIWGLLRAVLSLGASVLFGGELGDMLFERFAKQKFTDIAYDALSNMVTENNGSYNISELFSSMSDGFRSLMIRFGADIEALGADYSEAHAASTIELNNLASDIATPVAKVVSHAVGYVIVFLAVFIVITIIGWVIRLMAELPVLKGINHLLGGVFGALCGFIYLWIICIAISAWVESGIAENESRMLMQIVEGSYIFRFFCNFSPLDYVNIADVLNNISQ